MFDLFSYVIRIKIRWELQQMGDIKDCYAHLLSKTITLILSSLTSYRNGLDCLAILVFGLALVEAEVFFFHWTEGKYVSMAPEVI